jgi:hypothetical protein
MNATTTPDQFRHSGLRRSYRLFRKLVEKDATKVVNGKMIDWIRERLPKIDDHIDYQDSEQILRNICATIIYQNYRSWLGNITDDLFSNSLFVYTLFSSLQGMIDEYGREWALEWAIPYMDELLDIRESKRNYLNLPQKIERPIKRPIKPEVSRSTIGMVIDIMKSETFTNYSDLLPFSDSDQSEMRYFLERKSNQIPVIYDILKKIRVEIEKHDSTEYDNDNDTEKGYKKLENFVKNSGLSEWITNHYRAWT